MTSISFLSRVHGKDNEFTCYIYLSLQGFQIPWNRGHHERVNTREQTEGIERDKFFLWSYASVLVRDMHGENATRRATLRIFPTAEVSGDFLTQTLRPDYLPARTYGGNRHMLEPKRIQESGIETRRFSPGDSQLSLVPTHIHDVCFLDLLEDNDITSNQRNAPSIPRALITWV